MSEPVDTEARLRIASALDTASRELADKLAEEVLPRALDELDRLRAENERLRATINRLERAELDALADVDELRADLAQAKADVEAGERNCLSTALARQVEVLEAELAELRAKPVRER